MDGRGEGSVFWSRRENDKVIKLASLLNHKGGIIING